VLSAVAVSPVPSAVRRCTGLWQLPLDSVAMPAWNADNAACNAPMAESWVLSFVVCAESVAVWPATFALKRLVTATRHPATNSPWKR